MKTSDIEPERIKRAPRESTTIFSGRMESAGYTVHKIEMKRYVERLDDMLGEYSLLTVTVETDKGVAEMKYDEGFRGNNALMYAIDLLTRYSGLSSLINRSIIELDRARTQ